MKLLSSVGRCQDDDETCPCCRAIANPEGADRSDLVRLIEVLDYALARKEELTSHLVLAIAERDSTTHRSRNGTAR